MNAPSIEVDGLKRMPLLIEGSREGQSDLDTSSVSSQPGADALQDPFLGAPDGDGMDVPIRTTKRKASVRLRGSEEVSDESVTAGLDHLEVDSDGATVSRAGSRSSTRSVGNRYPRAGCPTSDQNRRAPVWGISNVDVAGMRDAKGRSEKLFDRPSAGPPIRQSPPVKAGLRLLFIRGEPSRTGRHLSTEDHRVRVGWVNTQAVGLPSTDIPRSMASMISGRSLDAGMMRCTERTSRARSML